MNVVGLTSEKACIGLCCRLGCCYAHHFPSKLDILCRNVCKDLRERASKGLDQGPTRTGMFFGSPNRAIWSSTSKITGSTPSSPCKADWAISGLSARGQSHPSPWASLPLGTSSPIFPQPSPPSLILLQLAFHSQCRSLTLSCHKCTLWHICDAAGPAWETCANPQSI